MYRVFFLIVVVAGCQQSSDLDFSRLSIAQLRSKVSDEDPNVRFSAIFQLGRRGGEGAAAIKELTSRMTDDHVQVRRVTAQTIGIVLAHSSPPYNNDIQAAINALKANCDTDQTVMAGVRIALASVKAK